MHVIQLTNTSNLIIIHFQEHLLIQNPMSSSDSDDNTKQFQDESLNNARIASPSEVMSTPSTRRYCNKSSAMKSVTLSYSDSQTDFQWRMLLTRSIKQANQQTPPKKEELTQLFKKNIQKTAQIKNKKGCGYQNMCPICLNKYNEVKGSLQCLHQFCYSCISQWSKTSTVCPCCRRSFSSILKLIGSLTTPNIRQMERVSVQPKQLVINTEYDYYTCYQCGLGDNEHVLFICDECDFYCCHVYCDPQLNNEVPDGDWFCLYCRANKHQNNKKQEQQSEEQLESDRQKSPTKYVAYRTRSRQRQSQKNQRNHLSILRNFRRAR